MRKKTLRNIGLLLLVGIAVIAVIGYRMYNKPHRSAATEDAITIPAAALAAAYGKDEQDADKKYLSKVVQVSGAVSEVSVNKQHKPVIVLTGSDMNSIQCTLLEDASGIKK